MKQNKANENTMTPLERRATYSLAGIYALRMLGLFMILPVFALYAEHLKGVTPVLVGLAIGIYGLTQSIFQIPFGMLSDKFGRKPIIIIGLLIFAVGSIVAALSDSIMGVIIGRALQGSGAIAAALMALTADLTREDHRLKAMAVIGMTIGLSFAVSMILGPFLHRWIGLPGIFWLISFLALAGILLVKYVVPTPEHTRFHRDTEAVPSEFKHVLRNSQLLRLDFGILSLHMILTASFVVLPLALRDYAGLAEIHHWYVYLPVLLLGIVAMVPFVIIAENKRQMKQVFVSAILVIALSEFSLVWFYHSLLAIVAILFAFFTAFNVLEASLPSLVAKSAPPDLKGTAMGVYSSSQFFGAFLGGAMGGWLHQLYGVQGVFLFCSIVALVWFLVASTMKNPKYLSSHLVNIGDVDESNVHQIVKKLTQVAGVAEAVVIPEEGMAYLMVDLKSLDREALNKFSVAHGS